MGSDTNKTILVLAAFVFIQLAKPGHANLSEKLSNNNTESGGNREEKCKLPFNLLLHKTELNLIHGHSDTGYNCPNYALCLFFYVHLLILCFVQFYHCFRSSAFRTRCAPLLTLTTV